MEEFEAGYGNPEDLMAQGPADAELAGGAPEEEAGTTEAIIAEGVQAFMESQDPQIAVEVVMMLAEQMGLTQGAPAGGAQPAPAAADPMGGIPMAKHGGKFGFFSDQNRVGEFMKFVNK